MASANVVKLLLLIISLSTYNRNRTLIAFLTLVTLSLIYFLQSAFQVQAVARELRPLQSLRMCFKDPEFLK